jgi:hypothetical protein
MRDRNKIISELYRDEKKEIHSFAKKLCKKNSYHLEELVSETFLVICAISEQRIVELDHDGYLKGYFINTMKNIYNDKDFCRNVKNIQKIKKQVATTIEIEDENGNNILYNLADDSYDPTILEGKTKDCLESLGWFNRKVFDLFRELKTAKAVCEVMNSGKPPDKKIDIRFVRLGLKEAKEQLKKYIRNAD